MKKIVMASAVMLALLAGCAYHAITQVQYGQKADKAYETLCSFSLLPKRAVKVDGGTLFECGAKGYLLEKRAGVESAWVFLPKTTTTERMYADAKQKGMR